MPVSYTHRAKPLDTQMLMEAASKHTLVVTMEENVINGGFGEHITRFYNEQGIYVNVLNIAIPDEYVEHGDVYKRQDWNPEFNAVKRRHRAAALAFAVEHTAADQCDIYHSIVP